MATITPSASFARAMGPRPVRVSEKVDRALWARSERRLRELEAMEPLGGLDLKSLLAEHGISRRSFLQWASATTAFLLLPPAFEPMVAKAAEVTNRIPVLWVEYQSCRGNSEALLRAYGPTVDELLFQMISLEFHQLLMASAGFQAEQRKRDAAKQFRGKYILIAEGSIPVDGGGAYGTIGAEGKTYREELEELSDGAAAVIAVGACAFYGGVSSASPNPTHAVGVSKVVKGKPVINIPACPLNPANLMGTIVHYALTGTVPALDHQLRPKFAFGYRIHDNCERRAHFDAGEHVHEWGDVAAKNNFCLYDMGCKGPMTYNNCSIVRYNEGTNWPIGSGHGCIGCSEAGFFDRYSTERPVANAKIPVPGLFGLGVENSVDKVGLGLLSAAAAGIGVHAVLSAVAKRRGERAEPAPSGPADSTS